MTDLVPPEDIERIVGVARHPTLHIARMVSAEEKVYILHSRECLVAHFDLRECPFSQALDNGIEVDDWTPDTAVYVEIEDEFLWPCLEAASAGVN